MVFFGSSMLTYRFWRGGKAGKDWLAKGIGLVSEIEVPKRGLGGNSIGVQLEFGGKKRTV